MLSNHSTQQTEVKLLKDEKWKVIQQNTFTRWVNKQLKHSTNSPQLENLATDFADGIFLIKLAEVLSGKGLPRFNKKPIMRTQKLDNVSLVLNFFQNQENIKIVNIGKPSFFFDFGRILGKRTFSNCMYILPLP
uniref:Calponin-homology (CH) domain-containing protein n=1 Tax=Meloidogyne incognita TaxID=6306 RepID=A0A914KZI4_MELIC